MAERANAFGALQSLDLGDGRTGRYYSLPHIERSGVGPVSRLPITLRIVLESVLRNVDGQRVTEDDVLRLSNWEPDAQRTAEIPFVVARILLQDFTGVPLLVDLAAMRSTVARHGRDPGIIEPLVPVDLVIDHSVQVDYFGSGNALRLNMEMEFHRNQARYQFLKWGTHAFHGFRVVPPGIGIVHQVNLEYLASSVIERDGIWFPDSLVGTDSHTTMVNGLGVVAWGVGGIEAEAGMLGQPVYFLTPDVVGVNLSGALRPGVTATDAVLHITQVLRKVGVVGRFVEYHGTGAASLTVPDRATIANMAPEYGATMGFFPTDEQTCRYLLATGRSPEHVEAVRRYHQAQGLFGMPRAGELSYSRVVDVDLADVEPSVAGPRRPQDRIALTDVPVRFRDLLGRPLNENGYGLVGDTAARRVLVRTGVAPETAELPLSGGGEQDPTTAPVPVDNHVSDRQTSTDTELEMMQNRPTPDRVAHVPPGEFPPATVTLGHGSIVIAAITSCTNTSNPAVMLAAGLVARRAVARGLAVPAHVKTSLGPGSRVVTEYLTATGLQADLDRLGFQTVGYGCTTCIGNSGPLDPHIEEAVTSNSLVVAAVLSGNRNFEARVHQSVKANFLMSPPLVVVYALAGRIDIDLDEEPLGTGQDGAPVYLRDLWPTPEEIGGMLQAATDPDTYRRLYGDVDRQNPMWTEIEAPAGKAYDWDPNSTYIQEPPYFDRFSMAPGEPCDVTNARALAILGDSVTTDHISPAGAIRPTSPAGLYLQERGVAVRDFNTYGSRRGNDRVMVRGTFANVRIKNLMVPGVEGGVTAHQPDGEVMTIYDAAVKYQAAHVPLVVIAGQEYGTGSSRDWAAKGTRLLGVKAVIAASFERIHRNNLVGMGVLPCQLQPGTTAQTLGLDGTEVYDIVGLEGGIRPGMEVTLVVRRRDGREDRIPVAIRIDTPVEVEYYLAGGILPFVLRQLIGQST